MEATWKSQKDSVRETLFIICAPKKVLTSVQIWTRKCRIWEKFREEEILTWAEALVGRAEHQAVDQDRDSKEEMP